ncbi:YcaO-like family protein [uncultured Jatrophihabitans sp.]|uniref:YcaO-like family protein n=1 Tax=uncultured Jatrophihabitans sp. TaxID=1610747 RepID=UPI0035CA5651
MAVDVVAGYLAALRESGQAHLTEFELTGYDRVGIPVHAVVHDGRDGSDAHGVGYGATAGAARIGALGEVAERVLLRPPEPDRLVRGSVTMLRGRLGTNAVVDPVSLVLQAGTDYDEARELRWVPATRWPTGEQVLVPEEFALSAPRGGTDGLITPVTNGLGAGDTLERAVSHGLLELVQRDGDNVRFRALDRGVVVDLAGCSDPAVLAARDTLRRAGIEPVVKLASTELACVVYCAGHDDDPATPPMALGALGEAAHPDRGVAVTKALLEYASSRARRVFAFGPLGAVRARHPDYLTAELARPLGEQEPRALEAMREWTEWDADRMRRALAPVLRERTTVPWSDLPSSAARTPDDLLRLLSGRVPDVLYVHAEVQGMHVAKVISPGLEVETLSYLRVGARAAAQLLELDRGLVGHGAPSTSGQLPVALSAADTERLGGPLWIDRDAVRDVVGELYPLYREPRRHAVDRTAGGAPDPGPAR